MFLGVAVYGKAFVALRISKTRLRQDLLKVHEAWLAASANNASFIHDT